MAHLKKNNLVSSDLVILLGLILFGFALYHHPLHSKTFYFDDRFSVENNEIIKTLNIPKIFYAFNTRFLVGLSFALNYKWCGLQPEGYRFINILIHGLNAFLVYILIKFTLNLYASRKTIFPCPIEWLAFFGSLLFLCHPIQTETVNYITQRFVLMGTFFYLLAVCMYIQYRYLSQKKYLMISTGSALAAMFCKEFVVTLPFMLALYEFYFLSSDQRSKGRQFKPLAVFFLIILIVPILLLRTPPQAIVVANIAATDSLHHVDITRAKYAPGRPEYFLTELNVICTYVRLLFLPINQTVNYYYPLSQGSFKDFLPGFFLFCLIMSAVMLYRSQRLISFCILWFLISLSLESSIFPIGNVINEYRLYLPSVGFALLISILVYSLKLNVKKLHMIAAIILIGFSILTFQRNNIWGNEMVLLNDVLKKYPNNANMHNDRGLAFYRQGDVPQAISDYNQSIAIEPDDPFPYNNLGWLYYNKGKLNEAALEYNKAIAKDPDYAKSYYNRALVYYHQGNLTQAIADFNKALSLDPEHSDTHYNRGLVFYHQGKIAQAIADFNKALEIDPKMDDTYKILGEIYFKEGNMSQALQDFKKVIEIDPFDAQAHYNCGNVYMNQNDFNDALSDYNKAINFKPQYAQAYINRAFCYYQLKDYKNARVDVQKAKDLGYTVNPGFIKALSQTPS